MGLYEGSITLKTFLCPFVTYLDTEATRWQDKNRTGPFDQALSRVSK